MGEPGARAVIARPIALRRLGQPAHRLHHEGARADEGEAEREGEHAAEPQEVAAQHRTRAFHHLVPGDAGHHVERRGRVRHARIDGNVRDAVVVHDIEEAFVGLRIADLGEPLHRSAEEVRRERRAGDDLAVVGKARDDVIRQMSLLENPA
jgi:hypothetical protein